MYLTYRATAMITQMNNEMRQTSGLRPRDRMSQICQFGGKCFILGQDIPTIMHNSFVNMCYNNYIKVFSPA